MQHNTFSLKVSIRTLGASGVSSTPPSSLVLWSHRPPQHCSQRTRKCWKSAMWSRPSCEEWTGSSSRSSGCPSIVCGSRVPIDLEMRKQIMPARVAMRAAKRWNPIAMMWKNMPNWNGVLCLVVLMTFWAKERNAMIKAEVKVGFLFNNQLSIVMFIGYMKVKC